MTYQSDITKKNFFLIVILSSLPLLLHLYTNLFAGYGIFRDELYYIACSNRLDTGYVDQPPLSIYILSISKIIFGNSLFAIRFLPAILSALVVFVTCMIVLKLNGGRAAIVICALAILFAPIYLAMFTYYSMNSLDIFLWTIAFYLIILILNDSKTKYWIILGIILGLGLLNKIGFLWLYFGLFLGLIITNKRKEFLTIKPYLTLLFALFIFHPYIIWNLNHDFAHIEFISNATSGKYSQLNPKDFIAGQFLIMNPASAIVWLCGLYYYLLNKEGKKYKVIGIIYVTTFLILIINGHSKPEYLAPAYTVLFAGGGIMIENVSKKKLAWLKYAICVLIIIFGVIITPFALPIFPVESYIKYSKALGMEPSTSEDKELSELPQFYADMFGWEELAKNISKVYLSIPENERSNVLVFGQNYGEASAIDYYSNKYPLPKAISNHNNYWLWGLGELSKHENPVVIIIGGDIEDHMQIFENAEQVATHTAKYSMPYENNIPIFIGRNIKVPIPEVWKRIKHYD